MVQTSNLPLDRLSCLLKTYFLNTDLKYRIKLLPVSIDVYINAQYEKPANQKDDVAIQTRVKKSFQRKRRVQGTVVPRASAHLYVSAHPFILSLKENVNSPCKPPPPCHPLRFVVIVVIIMC